MLGHCWLGSIAFEALDTRQRNLSVDTFEASEGRFQRPAMETADGHVHLLELARHDVEARWADYADRAGDRKGPK
jgi:hypothetical protein